VGVDKDSACAQLDFIAPIMSAISGVVVDQLGQPRGNVFVQLRLPDQVDLARGAAGAGYTTGPDGRFLFTDLPPGRYEIGFKTGGTIVTLALGERRVLPPLVVR
jgi:hypothetical protein